MRSWLPPVVFVMREDVTHVEQLRVEVNRRDDPELVSANVEDVEGSDSVDAVERLPKCSETSECRMLDDLSPGLQRRVRSGMGPGELAQCPVGDDAHDALSISY